MMAWKTISERSSNDKVKKAVINIDQKACYYFIDFYANNMYIDTIAYPEKSIYYVEDAAENYTLGILNVSKTA
jgi:hypothetical protein